MHDDLKNKPDEYATAPLEYDLPIRQALGLVVVEHLQRCLVRHGREDFETRRRQLVHPEGVLCQTGDEDGEVQVHADDL